MAAMMSIETSLLGLMMNISMLILITTLWLKAALSDDLKAIDLRIQCITMHGSSDELTLVGVKVGFCAGLVVCSSEETLRKKRRPTRSIKQTIECVPGSLWAICSAPLTGLQLERG